MSDHAQLLVCRTEDRDGVAARVVEDLVARGVVEATTTDSTLGGLGRRPGPAVAEALESPRDLGFTRLRVNGLEVQMPSSGLGFFFPAEGGMPSVSCPDCGHKLETKTLVARLEQLDEGTLTPVRCRDCGEAIPLADWAPEKGCAFGNLAFVFWNWSPLSDAFVARVAELCETRVAKAFEHI